MGLVDFILNLVGLYFWLNWRWHRVDPLGKATAATLAGTLRPAQARTFRGWRFLILLGALILFRAVVYWGIGAPSGWTGRLNLGVVVLAFRSDSLASMLLYSTLSYLHAALILYFWLISLALVNHRVQDSEPVMRLIRLHLGRVARWARPFQVLLPLVVVLLLWVGVNPILAWLGVTASPKSWAQSVSQGCMIAGGLVLSLKFLFPPILLLHLVNSYVYLGQSPAWEFINMTSRNILSPLGRLPLRTARIDFAPIVGAGLLLALLHLLPELLQTYTGTNRLWP